MRVLLILFISVVSFSSCHYIINESIRGNGHIVTRESDPGSFNSVDASGAVEVHLTQAQTSSVKIETDENLMEYLDVYTRGNTLVVQTRRGYSLDPSKGLVVFVSAPAYKSIEVSGASKIISENAISGVDGLNVSGSGASKISMEVSGGKIFGDISGATTMDLKGNTKSLELEASGASHIHAFDLVSDEASVDISGASSAEVTANTTLNAEASGASHIRYKGSASVSQHTSGASGVSKEG